MIMAKIALCISRAAGRKAGHRPERQDNKRKNRPFLFPMSVGETDSLLFSFPLSLRRRVGGEKRICYNPIKGNGIFLPFPQTSSSGQSQVKPGKEEREKKEPLLFHSQQQKRREGEKQVARQKPPLLLLLSLRLSCNLAASPSSSSSSSCPSSSSHSPDNSLQQKTGSSKDACQKLPSIFFPT